MCTIITLFQVHPAFPLVIAANRDERYERPSSGPELLAEPRAVVAGRDQLAGGTWFGVNAHGVAIAIADQGLADSEQTPGGARRDRPPPDPTKRSRGLLVLDALACPSVDAVSALLADLPADRYSPFSLLHADLNQAAIGHHVSGPVKLRELAPGVDVMVSAVGADHAARRTEYVLHALDPRHLATLDPSALTAALQTVLRHHTPADGPDDAICRHRADAGTVSSFVALLTPQTATSQLHCAVGPPCRTPYTGYAHLLGQLAGTPRP
jgi:hypothetical protein